MYMIYDEVKCFNVNVPFLSGSVPKLQMDPMTSP